MVVSFIIDPTVAEAVVAWKAVNFYNDLSFHKVIFEGDALIIVNALRKGAPYWSRFGQLIEDTQIRFHSLQLYVDWHVRRDANKATHQMAKLVLSQSLDQICLEECPFSIKNIVLAEQVVSL